MPFQMLLPPRTVTTPICRHAAAAGREPRLPPRHAVSTASGATLVSGRLSQPILPMPLNSQLRRRIRQVEGHVTQQAAATMLRRTPPPRRRPTSHASRVDDTIRDEETLRAPQLLPLPQYTTATSYTR